MRATLHDDALASYAGRFVWLEVNVDNPRNEAFLAAHQSSGYPMLFVIEPDGGRVTRTWSGGASVTQVRELLDSVASPRRSKADDAMLRGDRLLGENDAAAAATAYRDALRLGGPRWTERGRGLEQLFLALQVKGDSQACVTSALALAPGMPRSHPFVSVALIGLGCSLGAPPETGAAVSAKLEALATEALALPSASEDDRYQLYEVLFASRTRAGDSAGAHAVAERYFDDVERRPPPTSVDERMARELARVRAAVKLGVPDRVIPALEASERELSGDVDASSRLAAAYTAARRYDDAIAATSRGLGRGPGPEGTVRLLLVRAGAEARKGDVPSARRDLDAAAESASHIPAKASRDVMTTRIEQQRDGLSKVN